MQVPFNPWTPEPLNPYLGMIRCKYPNPAIHPDNNRSPFMHPSTRTNHSIPASFWRQKSISPKAYSKTPVLVATLCSAISTVDTVIRSDNAAPAIIKT